MWAKKLRATPLRSEWRKREQMKKLTFGWLLLILAGCGDRTFPPVIFNGEVDLRQDDGDWGIQVEDKDSSTKKMKVGREVHSNK